MSAPQAPKDIHEPNHDRVYCVRCGGNWPCQPAPVQPSSTVDEAALAGVIANAGRLVPVRQDMPDRDGGAMIAKLAVSRNHATLPNCDGCGRFTSNPDVKRWCEGQGDWHACHERMLCPKCAEKEATDD